jgi:hypothetical protein
LIIFPRHIGWKTLQNNRRYMLQGHTKDGFIAFVGDDRRPTTQGQRRLGQRRGPRRTVRFGGRSVLHTTGKSTEYDNMLRGFHLRKTLCGMMQIVRYNESRHAAMAGVGADDGLQFLYQSTMLCG